MQILTHAVGPVATNLYLVGDERSGEAIAIDTASPCLDWVRTTLREREWRLRLIVSTHGHWDHIGDNDAVQRWTAEEASTHAQAAGVPMGTSPAAAQIAVHPLDAQMLREPQPLFAPFEIVPSVPAIELQERGHVRFGEIDLEVLHTPGHTPGSVCLLDPAAGVLFAGDTLFAGGWGRTDLPGGSEEAIVASLSRLTELEDRVRVLPGHGGLTAIGRERPWLEMVRDSGRLPF